MVRNEEEREETERRKVGKCLWHREGDFTCIQDDRTGAEHEHVTSKYKPCSPGVRMNSPHGQIHYPCTKVGLLIEALARERR